MKRILTLVFFLLTLANYAQLVNAESKRIQNDSIRFTSIFECNFNTSKTNNIKISAFNFNFTEQLKSKNYLNYYLFFGNYERNEINSDIVTNASMFHFRYNRKINRTIRFELFTQVQNNRLLNIQLRNLYGVGTRIKFYKHKLLSAYLGNSYMFEYQKLYQEGENTFQFHRLNNYLSFHLKNKSHTIEVNSITYYQPSIEDFKNYRFTHESSLNFKITKNLFYNTSISLGFDNMPALGINKNNYSFKNGLKLVI
ncbi:MAG: DUF481 domain-containing protein [Limnohabitans sp.]|nr:DUF481 domain-containing protein [Limnohabitans sp.]